MDPLAVAFGAHALAGCARVHTPDGAAAEALRRAGLDAVTGPLDGLPDGAADAVALLAGELSAGGEAAEALVAEAARVLRPGGRLAATAAGALHAAATGARPAGRALSAEELGRLLGLAGFDVTGRWAPGAASRLAGAVPAFDPVHDRAAGLLDAAPTVAAAAIRYPDDAARSRAFFGNLPRKVVAAAVVCRDAAGRLLVVYDAFKQHWTVPGGVVEAGEDPRSAAVREAREEAGVAVTAGALLGVFAMSWPDRLLFVYAAQPAGDPTPRPLHAHEIEAAEWVDLVDALPRLDARIGSQVRRCLDAPGETWDDT